MEEEMEAKEQINVSTTNTNAVEFERERAKKKMKNLKKTQKKMEKRFSKISENDLVGLGIKVVEGGTFYGRFHPAGLTRNSSFKAKLIGFDKSSYAYIHILERDVEEKYSNFKQKYFSNIRQFAPLKLHHVHVGQIIVAKLDTRGFSRVRVLSIRHHEILVLDVDEEKTAEVSEGQIFSMPPESMMLPFKSIKVQLIGLEMFAGTGVVGHVVTAGKLHVGAVYTVTVKKAGLIPSVKMCSEYSNGDEGHVFLNDTILSAIRDFRPMPKVLKKNVALKGGIISHSDEKGHIWYQYPSSVVELLHKLRPRPECVTLFKKKEILEMIKSGTDRFAAPMYSHKNSGDYCRVKILGIPKIYNSEKVAVECMDSGILKMIQVDHLLPFESFEKIFSEIPDQCLKLCLPRSEQFSQLNLYYSRTYVMNHELLITQDRSEDGLPIALMWMYYPDVYNKQTLREAFIESRNILGKDYAFYQFIDNC